MTRVAIVQSSYIPWRGYFALIAHSDVFVFLDSVQFTRRDWRTRNRIQTPSGPTWLSIPVHQKGNYHAPIDAIQIATPDWAAKHLRAIQSSYRRASFFADIFPQIEAAYNQAAAHDRLSLINQSLTTAICELLNLNTRLTTDTGLLDRNQLDRLDPTQRLVELVRAAGGDAYLSGPSAKAYLAEQSFHQRNVQLSWMDYARLPTYPQMCDGFEANLSIIDALMNVGAEATRAMLVPADTDAAP